MTIHYHGTPITPRAELLKMAGRHFCVPFSDSRDADVCQMIGQSLMFDNGAFTTFKKGKKFEPKAFYEWLEPRLGNPHWAVIPDVIGGGVEDNRALVKQWPFPAFLGAPVWHMAEPIDYLLELADLFPKLCFGSSEQYWQVGSEPWQRRCDEAFNALSRANRHLPWVHMLRGLSLGGDRWPFSSVDAVTVAIHHQGFGGAEPMCPERMARNIDTRQCGVKWTIRAEQIGGLL